MKIMLSPYNNLILYRHTYQIELKKASLNLLKNSLFQMLKHELLFTILSDLIIENSGILSRSN